MGAKPPRADRSQPPDLTAFDTAFRNSPVDEPLDLVPDDEYFVRVEKVSLLWTRPGGRPALRWVLRILGPRHRGKVLWRTAAITQTSVKYLKSDLLRCGVRLSRLSELPAHLEELGGLALSVTKTTQEDRERIFFNRLLSAQEASSYEDDSEDR